MNDFKLLWTAIVMVFVLGSAVLLVRAAPRIPREITHNVDGRVAFSVYLGGLDSLKPLPERLTIQVVLPEGFELRLPTEFRVDAEGHLTHDGELRHTDR